MDLDARTQTKSAREQLWEMVDCFRHSQLLFTALNLKIADHLQGTGKSASELAAALAADPSSLERLLKALCALGIIATDGSVFYNAPIAEILVTAHCDPLANTARYFARPNVWTTWGGLPEAVLTGKMAFEAIHGMDAWSFRSIHPEEGRIFDAAMTPPSSQIAKSLAVAIGEVEAGSIVVDVAGGRGALLEEILQLNPSVRGILMDRRDVLDNTNFHFADPNRVTLFAGDLFSHIPPGGDKYLLKAILHDWDDEKSISILKNCARVMREGGEIIILERILDDARLGLHERLSDLHMMLMLGGKERTLQQFQELVASAGLALRAVEATDNHYYKLVVQAV